MVGGLTAYYSFWPFLTISPFQPLAPSDPFSGKFIISNDGLLPIYEVTIECVLKKLNYESGGKAVHLKDGLSHERSNSTEVMYHGDKSAVSCHHPYITIDPNKPELKLIDGDMTVKVTFKPVLAYWTINKHFRFIAAQSSEQMIHWLPKPVSISK